METNAVSPIQNEIATLSLEMDALFQTIHANPEAGRKEYATSRALADALRREGFTVDVGCGALETAFFAQKGEGARITYTAEMDALPTLGHACGHSIIGVASVYAGIVLSRVIANNAQGRVVVIGTPAEEGYSGKVDLIKAGWFNDTHAALQIHPSKRNAVECHALWRKAMTLEYFGTPAHAATAPWTGVNALDAMTLFYYDYVTLT